MRRGKWLAARRVVATVIVRAVIAVLAIVVLAIVVLLVSAVIIMMVIVWRGSDAAIVLVDGFWVVPLNLGFLAATAGFAATRVAVVIAILSGAFAAAPSPGTRRRALAVAIAVIIVIVMLVITGVLFLFRLEQCHAVGERDLVIIRMDFREGQEAMAVAAILNEGCLQRRLYARHFGQVDVALQLAAGGAFEVEFLDAVTLEDDHAGLFGVAGIDEHFAAHVSVPMRLHGKDDRFSAPVRRRLLNPGVLLRERGMMAPAARGGTFTGADKNRSSSCALAVAWVMPEIVLMSRIAGTVPLGVPLRGSRSTPR